MTRYRFTLAQLMAVVFFLALGFAGLHVASVLWASAVFTLTVAGLSVAVLGAMARRGRARMTWTGFALFGWVYLGTTFGPWAAANGVTAPPYVTRLVLDYWDSKLWSVHRAETHQSGEELFSRFTPVLPPPPVAAPLSPALAPTPRAPLVLTPDAFQFRRIGHCLAAILFGLVGAIVGRLMAPRDEQPNP
jgi:hypothetical protein